MEPDEVPLPVERLQIMRHRHQIGFGRQLIGRMAPVAVLERAELAALDELLQPRLHVLEIARRGHRPVRDRLRQRDVVRRIGLQRGNDIHPVQRVQMIEMHDVVVHLRSHDVADDVGVLRAWHMRQRVLHRAHRGQRMGAGADAADALGERPGVARVAAAQDHLDAAEHGAALHASTMLPSTSASMRRWPSMRVTGSTTTCTITRTSLRLQLMGRSRRWRTTSPMPWNAAAAATRPVRPRPTGSIHLPTSKPTTLGSRP